jgi:hypothetical protein
MGWTLGCYFVSRRKKPEKVLRSSSPSCPVNTAHECWNTSGDLALHPKHWFALTLFRAGSTLGNKHLLQSSHHIVTEAFDRAGAAEHAIVLEDNWKFSLEPFEKMTRSPAVSRPGLKPLETASHFSKGNASILIAIAHPWNVGHRRAVGGGQTPTGQNVCFVADSSLKGVIDTIEL